MAELQYTCPGCAAPIEYDIRQGKMACSYCLSTYSVEEVEAYSRTHTPNDEAAAASSPLPPPSAQAQTGSYSTLEGSAQPASQASAQPGAQSSSQPATEDGPQPSTDSTTQREDARAASSTEPIEPTTQWTINSGTTLSETEEAQFHHLQCNACGAQILTDPEVISTRCGYCNNTLVAVSRMESTRIPDVIIPFAIDREAMIRAFKQASTGKFLLPPTFRKDHTIRQAVGMYVPFWLFDGRAQGSIDFTCTDTTVSHETQEQVTTKHTYKVEREGSLEFAGIPVCGSIHLDRERADAAEPFNPQGIVPFQTAYLSGYAAQSYTIDSSQTLEVGEARALESFRTFLQEGINHDIVNVKRQDVRFEHGKITYALLPIWLLNIEYRGNVHQFTINGQTGEVVGVFPHSRARLWRLRTAYFLGGLLGGGFLANIASNWLFA